MSSELVERKAVTTGGVPYTIKLGRGATTSRANATTGTLCPSFQDVKDYLSEKPISRPPRTRPID
jgi:hypothetical protein